MGIQEIRTEVGHSMPPEGSHTVTTHFKLWGDAMKFRDGDPVLFAKIKSTYPRFMPWGPLIPLTMAMAGKLGLPQTTRILPFVSPDVFDEVKRFTTSSHRTEGEKLADGDLSLHVVDVDGIRLYLVTCPAPKLRGILGVWQNQGNGISTRLAETLLAHQDSIEIVPFQGDLIPPPTYLPETEAHAAIRARISGLLRRAALDPTVSVQSDDVYLYPTGMAAIYRTDQVVRSTHPGKIVVLGAIFNNTWHLFEESSAAGFQHFGKCDDLTEFEAYLEAEAQAGRKVSYVFTEFPSNPSLVAVDLKRLRELADQYDFLIVLDDTVGSFSNLDLFPVADVIVSSLAKSFSGYANVMTGSAVLNPSSSHYPVLKPAFASSFHTELFGGDAAVLLSNSEDYLSRSTTLNTNAAALAARLQEEVSNPASPVSKVLYPRYNNTGPNYSAVMRQPTADFTPGYGGLLSVDFEDVSSAEAFYDNLEFHHGQHFGAHLSIALPYNAMMYGRDPEQAAYHAAYGLREAQVRIAAGLEATADLLETVEVALEKAAMAKRRQDILSTTARHWSRDF